MYTVLCIYIMAVYSCMPDLQRRGTGQEAVHKDSSARHTHERPSISRNSKCIEIRQRRNPCSNTHRQAVGGVNVLVDTAM